MAHTPSLAYIGFDKEVTSGTAVSPVRFARWSAIREGSEQMRVNYYRDGSTRDNALGIKLATWHNVAFTSWMFPDVSTALLAYFLGGPDTVTGGADPYQHVFSELPDCTGIPTVTVENSMGCGNEIDRTAGALVDQITIKSKAGDLTSMDYMLMGATSAAQASAATVTFEADRPMTYIDGTLTLTGLDVAPVDVTEVTINMKNGGEQIFTFGQGHPVVIFPTARSFDVDFTVFVPDNKLYREVFYGSAGGTTPSANPAILSNMTLKYDLGGTPDHFVQLALNNIYMTDAKPTFDANAKAFMVQAKGTLVRPGSGSMVTVTAKNAVSAAYV